MKYIYSFITIVFLSFPSIVHAQCYDLSVKDIPSDRAKQEDISKFSIQFMFCNDEEEVPSDAAGNSSITICSVGLVSAGPPTQAYLEIDWKEYLDCWYGTIVKGNNLPKGCDTITLEFDSSSDAKSSKLEKAVAVNIQPAGIVVGSPCFDPEDDFITIEK